MELKRNQEQEQPQMTRKKKPVNSNEDFYGNNKKSPLQCKAKQPHVIIYITSELKRTETQN